MADQTYAPKTLSGPFADSLAPVVSQQPFPQPPAPTGYENKAAGIAGLAANFLHGLGEGRMRSALAKAAQKEQSVERISQYFQGAMSNPNLTPEAREELGSKYKTWLSTEVNDSIKAQGKNAHPIVGAMGKIFERLAGGRVEGGPKQDVKAGDEMIKGLVGFEYDPKNTIQGRREEAQGALLTALEKIKSANPNANQREAQAQLPSELQTQVQRAFGPAEAQSMIKQGLGIFSPERAPHTKTPAEEKYENQQKEDERLRGMFAPPPPAAGQPAPAGQPPPPATAWRSNPFNPQAQPQGTPPLAPAGGGQQTSGKPLFMAPGPAQGLVSPGNIDLSQLSPVRNSQDPSRWSTVNSVSFTDENPKSPTYGKDVLVRGYVGDKTVDPKDPTALAQVKAQYYRDGKHLGVFENWQAADAYAQRLHEDWQAGKIPGVQMSQDKATAPPPQALPQEAVGLLRERKAVKDDVEVWVDGKKEKGVTQVLPNQFGARPGFYDQDGHQLDESKLRFEAPTKEEKELTEFRTAHPELQEEEAKTELAKLHIQKLEEGTSDYSTRELAANYLRSGRTKTMDEALKKAASVRVATAEKNSQGRTPANTLSKMADKDFQDWRKRDAAAKKTKDSEILKVESAVDPATQRPLAADEKARRRKMIEQNYADTIEDSKRTARLSIHGLASESETKADSLLKGPQFEELFGDKKTGDSYDPKILEDAAHVPQF